MAYSAQITIALDAADHSDATQRATELSQTLQDAGYEHVSTAVLDGDGEMVADFALPTAE